MRADTPYRKYMHHPQRPVELTQHVGQARMPRSGCQRPHLLRDRRQRLQPGGTRAILEMYRARQIDAEQNCPHYADPISCPALAVCAEAYLGDEVRSQLTQVATHAAPSSQSPATISRWRTRQPWHRHTWKSPTGVHTGILPGLQ